MAFMLGQNLTFMDSFQFMSQSLRSLVNNLPTEAFKEPVSPKVLCAVVFLL